MNSSNRMPLQRPPNMSPQQFASTPTNQRFFLPRFGHSSIPSYPRPRSSASKPNPDCSPLLEDPFSAGPCNYPEEDSMRNNFGSSRDEDSFANGDSSFQSPNSSAYYSCYDSFVDSPAISPKEEIMNNPQHFDANTPQRFQQQNARTPQRFQQQNARTPQRFRQQNARTPQRFQQQNERTPQRFQKQNEDTYQRRFQQQNEDTYQQRFQQQNEDTYQGFQQQNKDTYQRFQPQIANATRRFQPQNANIRGFQPKNANNGFQNKFPNKRKNFVKNKPYPFKKNPVNNPQSGTKLQVVPGWSPAWQSDGLSQGHCWLSIPGLAPPNWSSENRKEFFSPFSTTTHMETQKKESSSLWVPLGADASLFRATETRSTGGGVNVPSGTDTSNPVGIGLDSSVKGTGSDDWTPVTEVVNKKRLKRQRQKERKQLEKELKGADASLLRATQTRSTGGEVNVPSGKNASNPVGMDLDSTVRGTGLDASADDQTPMTEVVNKKRLKRQRQKERKQLEKNLKGILIAGAGGATEEEAKTSTSGATSNSVKESHPCNEESHLLLQVICKDDSTEMTFADKDHITSVIDDRLIDGTIASCQVHETFLQSNGLNIVCEDKKTVDALKALINQLPGPVEDHPGYLAMAPGDQSPMKRFFAWFPGNRQPEDNIKLLGTCNKGLDIRKIEIKSVIPGDGGNTLVLGVGTEMLDFLKARDFSLFCGARGSIQLKEPTLKHTRTETAREKTPPPEDPPAP